MHIRPGLARTPLNQMVKHQCGCFSKQYHHFLSLFLSLC